MRKKLLIAAAVLTAILFGAAYFGQASLGGWAYDRGIKRQMKVDVIARLDDGLHIGLCGTGSPMPDPSRKGPCTLVIAGKRLFVVDLGSGAPRNFGPMGISAGKAEAVLLTHFHSDHMIGLGDFLFSHGASNGGNIPLTIYGPPGTEEIVDATNALTQRDRNYRDMHHGDLMPQGSFLGKATPFELDAAGEAIVLDNGGLKITAFTVEHGGIDPAVGYRFDYKGRSVVISGDTSRSAHLEKMAAGADILIHEALNVEMVDAMRAQFKATDRARMATIFEQIKHIHTTPVEAAKSASKAKVRMLVLSHIIPPAPGSFLDSYFAKGTDDAFSGEIVMGHDGMLFSLMPGNTEIQQENLM